MIFRSLIIQLDDPYRLIICIILILLAIGCIWQRGVLGINCLVLGAFSLIFGVISLLLEVVHGIIDVIR